MCIKAIGQLDSVNFLIANHWGKLSKYFVQDVMLDVCCNCNQQNVQKRAEKVAMGTTRGISSEIIYRTRYGGKAKWLGVLQDITITRW